MIHALKIIAIAGFILLLPDTAVSQPMEIRDDRTPVEGQRGERISALINAINENSSEVIESFFHEHVSDDFGAIAPMEQHIAVFRGTHRQTGGVDFYSVRSYESAREQTVIIVRDRIYEGWHSLVLEFDDPEERISSINITRARSPIDAGGSALSQDELIKKTRAAVRRGCDHDVFSGTVLLARGGEVLFETACGDASKRFGVSNTIDTKFNIGSMNKMFTATAIMQLAEDGRVALDDTLSRYVDESWLPAKITEKITLHHLLTHTSGLGSYFNDTFTKSSRALYRELEDYKPLLAGESLAFVPGSRFQYSNTGMFLLGVVIEQVTGRSYFEYIRENVYRKAGMANSESYSMDEPVPNLAIGYIPDPENEYGWRNNIFEHVIKGGPAGGGFSTVGDLHRYATALMNGALVSDESLERMWEDHSGVGYGYGFGVSAGPDVRTVGHSGGFPGLNGNLDIFPDSGYVVAVLSNYDGGASPLADHIRQLVGRARAM